MSLSKNEKKELLGEIRKAERKENWSALGKNYNELGAAYRSDGDVERAIDAYTQCSFSASKVKDYEFVCLSHRVLAELLAEQGDRDKSLHHLELYGKAAKQWKNFSQQQLHLHVTAWVYEKLWVQQKDSMDDLRTAVEYCKRSLDFISNHGWEIDEDKEAVETGKSSARRRAGLHRLMAGIFANLEEAAEAEKYLKLARDYARCKKDLDLEHECLLVELDFAWKSRLDVAKALFNFVRNHGRKMKGRRYADALLEYARALLLSGKLSAAVEIFYELISKHLEDISTEDAEILNSHLVLIYKIEAWETKTRGPVNENTRRYTEKVADAYTSLGALTTALQYYEMMLKMSSTNEERAAAFLSLAVTAKELAEAERMRGGKSKDGRKFSHLAVDYYEKVLEIEKEIGDKSKVNSTEDHLFAARCLNDASRNEIQQEVERLEHRKPPGNMGIVYEAAFAVFNQSGEGELAEEYSRRLREWEGEHGEQSSFPDAASPSIPGDKIDQMNDNAILAIVYERAQHWESNEQLRKNKDQKDKLGETRLHSAARTDDPQQLAKLIQLGYSVDARCFAGWTPLSEAVNADLIANVRLLLTNGAKVDLASNEILHNSLEVRGKGMTPLMEACEHGRVAIARLLLQFKASVTLSNADGWTAVDFLYIHIQNAAEAEKRHLEDCVDLLKEMREKQQQLGFTVREGPPPAPQDIYKLLGMGMGPNLQPRKSTKRISRGERGVDEYKSTIQSMGSRTHQRSNHEKLLDDDDFMDEDEGGAEYEDCLHGSSSGGRSSRQNRRSIEKIRDVEADLLSFPDNRRSRKAEGKRPKTEGENGIKIVPDEGLDEEDEFGDHKRRRTDANFVHKRSGVASLLPSRALFPRNPSRSSVISPPPTLPSPNKVVSTPSTSRRTLSPLRPATTNLVVSVEFGYMGTESTWRCPKMISLSRNATIADLSSSPSLTPELSGKDHSWWQGGQELDGSVSLSFLHSSSSSSPLVILTLKCRLKRLTAMMDFEERCDEADRSGPLLEALNQLTQRRVLELRDCCAERGSWDAFWAAVPLAYNASSKLEKAHVEGVVSLPLLEEEWLAALAGVAHSCGMLSLISCRLDGHRLSLLGQLLTDRSRELGKDSSLRQLDISRNHSISSASSVSSFLSATPLLTKFVFCDIDELAEPESLMEALAGLSRLGDVSLTDSNWLNGRLLTTLTSSKSLRNLNLSHSSFSTFTIEDSLGSSLQSLHLSGCRLSSSLWISISAWLRSGAKSLKKIFLSDSTATLEVVAAAIASDGPIEVVDISNCSRIDVGELLSLVVSAGQLKLRLRVDQKTKESILKRPGGLPPCFFP